MKPIRIAAIAIGLAAAGTAYANREHPAVREPTPGCGTFKYHREHIGPLDYRAIAPDLLKLIEDYHFTRQVEMLRRGQSGRLGNDLAYTLNAIPNHPRALRATIEYFDRNGIRAAQDMGMGLDCWLDRAVSYRPEDPIIRILVADAMLKKGNRNAAVQHLKVAADNARNSSTVHYNLGLLYLDLKDYDRSVEHARKAYELGAPLPGLKNLLAEAGKWRE